MDYFKHYNLLVNRAKNRILESYTETHHVVPVCMGGSNSPNNLVDLTPEEHYVAHQLLVKMYPKNLKLLHAANMMTVSSKKQNRNNKRYGWLKKNLYSSEEWKNKTSNHFKSIRKYQTPPTLNKKWYNNGVSSKMFLESNVPAGWSHGRLFKFKSEESKNKAAKNLTASGHNKGLKTPQEVKNKISEKLKGKKKPTGFGENRRGIMNPSYGSTYIWVNDGVKNYRWLDKNNIPNNLKIGMVK